MMFRKTPGVLLGFAVCACSAPQQQDGEWPKMTCGSEYIASTEVQSTFPVTKNVATDLGEHCWFTQVNETVTGEGGPFVFERAAGSTPGACQFKGFANQVRAEINEGLCEIPTSTGFVRLSIREPVGFNPKLASSGEVNNVEIAGEWQELRGKDLYYGKGSLFLRVTQQRKPTGNEGMTKPKLNAYSSCAAPRCFNADFSRKGTLLDGGELPCRRFVDTFAQEPFSVRVDERGYVAFAEKNTQVAQDQWLPGIPSLNGCEVTAFSGQRAGPFQEHKLTWDPAGKGTMKMLVDALYTDQNVTSLCKTSWETTIEPCP